MEKNDTVKIRLSKKISLISDFSRKEAEVLIRESKIKVNQKIETSPAFLVDNQDLIQIDEKKIPNKVLSEIKIIAFNKPRGCVVTKSDEKDRKTIYSLLPRQYSNFIYIGRLDINTEGLLLLTNSGSFAREMELPANGFEREYEVRVFGLVTPEKLNRMVKGVSIDRLHYKASHVTIKKRYSDNSKNTLLSIILTTGKNREVRKLMEFFNLKVNRLKRVRYGSIMIGSLPLGGCIEFHRTKTHKLIKEIELKCQKNLTL